jgi:hypothetical protein
MKKQITAVSVMLSMCEGVLEAALVTGGIQKERAEELITDGHAVVDRFKEYENLIHRVTTEVTDSAHAELVGEITKLLKD